jgi:dihydroorotase
MRISKTMKILIKGGRVIDPANKIDGICDILVEECRISKTGKNISSPAEKTIDATGKIVMPGIVDMHVHLREPGREDKETVASGTAAAAKGGVTSILAMPNTFPAIDSPETALLLKESIKRNARVNVYICGALSLGRRGKELTNFASLKESGVIAFSDDGSSIDDAEMMLVALEKSKEQCVPVICHCEDKRLSGSGAINLGLFSTKLGLRGISKESEYKRVERDIELAAKIGARIHIAHVSCAESIEIISQAKKKGIKVTCETAPHYLSLTEEAVAGYDSNMKMNPPLRSAGDREALRRALAQGAIDAIASDHAPHTENEKEIEFERAEFGVIGLETELAVTITELIETNLIGWSGLVERMCWAPAQILGIPKGTLSAGAGADIIIVDPGKEWVVQKTGFVSKSKNSSFLGRALKGVVAYTICNGSLVYQAS